MVLHNVTNLQAEASDLGGADVNIIRTGEVEYLTTEEAEAVGQDLQHPFAVHQARPAM